MSVYDRAPRKNCDVKRDSEKRGRADTRHDGTATSDADAEYFSRAMADVVRLPPDPRGRVRATPEVSLPRTPDHPRPPVEDDPDATADGGFVAPGVDRRELRKLRRGDYVATDTLDLHGITAAEAVARVKRFIENSRHDRHRCVCIVHGRGLHSEGNESILKTSVRRFLREHRSVLAYSDAPRSDGGTGAVYVLLRK